MAQVSVHTVIVGGGLAGLGCAIGLKRDGGKTVFVIEKTKNPFAAEGDEREDRKVRYDPTMPASYKSAGMMELFVPQTSIANYFMRETRRLFDEVGIPVHKGGMSICTEVAEAAFLGELVMEKPFLTGDELKVFAEKEPNLNYKNIEGIYRQAEASSANPEDAMKALFGFCQNLGVQLEFEQSIQSITRSSSNNRWVVKTQKFEVTAENIIIAAGPWSKDIMKQFFTVTLPMQTILGIITELVPPAGSPNPYLNGLVMGSRSVIQWALDDFEGFLTGKKALEVTRYRAEKRKKTTHLYISCQKGNVFVGGPRIALEDDYKQADLDPELYDNDMQDSLKYARELVRFPADISEKGRWSGLMAFPSDERPLVGAVDRVAFPGLYLCTGFASSGFRMGVGAGNWLGRSIAMNGGIPLFEETGVPVHNCNTVSPEGRLGSPNSQSGCCSTM